MKQSNNEKRIFNFLIMKNFKILMLALLGLVVASCNKDDDQKPIFSSKFLSEVSISEVTGVSASGVSALLSQFQQYDLGSCCKKYALLNKSLINIEECQIKGFQMIK